MCTITGRAAARTACRANDMTFFVADQIPATGATLPIDGGLPEAFLR